MNDKDYDLSQWEIVVLADRDGQQMFEIEDVSRVLREGGISTIYPGDVLRPARILAESMEDAKLVLAEAGIETLEDLGILEREC